MQAGAVEGSLADGLDGLAIHRVAVHQATGFIVAQLGVSPEQALLRLRAHAFVEARPVNEVARQVVDGTLRFDGGEGAT